MEHKDIVKELKDIVRFSSAEWCDCFTIKRLKELIRRLDPDHTPAQKD